MYDLFNFDSLCKWLQDISLCEEEKQIAFQWNPLLQATEK